QLFGRKSERFVSEPNPQQLPLGAMLATPGTTPEATRPVAAHSRRAASRDAAATEGEALPFFDESRVPVETIVVANPEVAGLAPEFFEVIGEKVSFRLAQRPGSYVVLKYVRPLIKRRDTGT